MKPDEPDRSQREILVEALTALVLAIDQRAPHLERAGEREIVMEAAALRAAAVERLAELREGS